MNTTQKRGAIALLFCCFSAMEFIFENNYCYRAYCIFKGFIKQPAIVAVMFLVNKNFDSFYLIV